MNDVRREEDGERQRVDAEEQERIGERPEKPEDRAAIARLQIARREGGDQLAVAVEEGEVVHLVAGDRSSVVSPAPWEQI